jgi:hypothetical protein
MMTEPATTVEARLGSTPLRGWPQRLLHLAVLVVGWGLFFWGWHDVLGQRWDTTALVWLIVGSLVLLPAMTIAWVLHNVGIHRRKGPRTGLRKVDETYRHDWNGREIRADFAALAHASVVVIDVEGEHKVYRAGGVLPTVQWTVTQTPHLRPAANAAPKDAAAELARARAA